MTNKTSSSGWLKHYLLLLSLLLLTMGAGQVFAASSAGYTKYFIPGDEDNIQGIFSEFGNADIYSHSIITVTAWSDNTTIYYDHWEDGYDFDPDNPGATADEIVVLANKGDFHDFESPSIPLPRTTAIFYDGRDFIYVAGGTTTVTRAAWLEPTSTTQSVAWEVYPLKPQLTTYILPFGEDLSVAPKNYVDFSRVFTLIQATADGTVVTVDLNGDGTPDNLDQNRDGTCDAAPEINLNAGEVFLLEDATLCAGTLDKGTVIQSTDTIQVQYVIGSSVHNNYEIRGLSAFPRGFWDNEYYAPVDGAAVADTDIYLYNPHATSLTINYQTADPVVGSGTFTIAPGDTLSFYDGVLQDTGTGQYVPNGSGVYFDGSDVFWGVSSVDTESRTYDWGYSLVPAFMLSNEYFMGWAPGSYPVGTGADADNSGLFITPAQDNTTIFVDHDSDGTVDQTYLLNRLATQYVFDPDGDLSGANVWGTGPYTVAYGQNPDLAPGGTPAIDVGYTTIPGIDFVDLVLDITKTADPVVVDTAIGSQSTFTLTLDSFDFSVDSGSISITDTLPIGWQYVSGSTSITLADLSTSTADPVITGSAATGWILTWPSATLGNMAENQQITITFTGQTTQLFATGTITRNQVEATGSRTVGTVTQTFTTTDSAFNTYGSLDVSKTSSGVDPLYPGDQFTYTVTVTNPATAAANLTGIAIYDPLPTGTGYVASSSQVTAPASAIRTTEYYIASGNFSANSYNLTLDQDLASDYFVIIQGSDGDGSSNNNTAPAENYAALTADPFGTGDLAVTGANNIITLTRQNSVDGWVGVVTVVEAVGDQAGSGFSLLDVQRVAHSGTDTTGTDTSANAWTDINQVMLMGGFNGAGCDTAESNNSNHTVCFARIWPTGSDTINWTRDAGGTTLSSATSTVMMVEWGADWTVQRRNITGTNGGNGADVPSEYNTAAISSVPRANTWVWGTGHTDDNGIGDGAEGVLITLGDGANQNINESTVAVATEYNNTAIDFEVYALTHADLAVDYWFKGDADSANLTVDVPVNSATSNRMALSYNGQNGTGTAYPRPILSARYLNDTTVRLERRRSGQNFPAWVQGIDFSSLPLTATATSAAGDPPNFVQSSDGYSLAPGETLTLTYDVTVDDPLAAGITSITNVASVNSNEITLPSFAEVTNIVVNPSAAMATVGELIWLDSNGDGIKDVGEPGLSGVEVTLRDQFGTPVATTTTDTIGRYLFTGVPAGSGYYVEVTAGLPAGVSQTAPAGHSDNRSDTFDLLAGEDYTDANLGYAPDPLTASFGNLVWSDADGDGVADAGEPGLDGVDVELYLDDGDGIFNPSVDTLVSSTTTAPDGSYLFTGITPSGSLDYFVYVDSTQAGLTGFTATTGTSQLNYDVAGGDVLINNDFGFQPSAGSGYSIKDMVWYDADGDGTLDAGESGIAGVTVNLLDASSNIIATTTTDSNGDYSFSGVPDGGNYTAQVTDTAGILNNYYGTTPAALAGAVSYNNLSADVDNSRTGTSTPSFGYNLTSTIGDTVFNDLNGNGVQDPGENGISGVEVTLYTYDTGTSTYIHVADLTTDSNGKYLFTGLADDDYRVSINSPPSGYSFTGTDADAGRAGDQSATQTIAGGNTILDIDFGYQAPTPRTISGTLWDDKNSDGVIDPGENGLAGVTVELEQGGTVVATTTTDANGEYSFTGLVGGSNYTVKVTDTSGIINGYDPTYEKTGGIGGPFDGEEAVDITSGDVDDIRFGYIKPVPTLAVISSFKAFTDNGQTVVQWQTASESGTVGFYLDRLNPQTGVFERITDQLLPGLLHSPAGGIYQYIDVNAVPGQTSTYKLIEVEIRGGTRSYGPYTVMPLPISHRADVVDNASRTVMTAQTLNTQRPAYSRQPHQPVVFKVNSITAISKNSLQRNKRRGRDQFKLAVKENNIYCLKTAELASFSEMSEDRFTRLIRRNRLSLSSGDHEIPWLPMANNTEVCFYGTGIDSIYTDTNVYWLNRGRGKIMVDQDGGQPDPVDNQSFRETVHVEENNWPLTALFDDPESDYWLWDYIVSGNPTLGSKDFILRADGLAVTPGTATLKVSLQGATDTTVDPDHHVRIMINGTQIGESTWNGTDSEVMEFSFDQTLLLEGDNRVTVTGLLDSGAPYSIFYVNSFDLSYGRDYTAVADKLIFSVEEHEVISVDGFSVPEISVFDISDPDTPILVTGVSVDTTANGNRASFQPTFGHRYIAAASGAMITPDLEMVDFSTLKRRRNTADYLLITPAELAEQARVLADYRESQGYSTMVVELDDIYNSFNHGLSGPTGIHNFLAYAYERWRRPPQYVVLVGEGTYDYKNLQGYGDNLLPPQMVNTPHGLFISDNALADVEGSDGLPEMAIGRLPAATVDELLSLINKIKAYEVGGGSWVNRVLMSADNPDQAGSFSTDSDAVAALLPSSYLAEKISLADLTTAEARALLINNINNGALLLNYIGHGGMDRFADEGLLLTSDVAALANGDRLPVLTAMTCVSGRFGVPGYDSITEALLLHEIGGTIASWAPTGLSENSEAVTLDKELFNAVFVEDQKILGDAVMQAMEEYNLQGGRRDILEIYNLLGDPALKLW